MKQTVQRKNYRLDTTKLRRAQKELRTKTETETIHMALDLVTNEVRLARALKSLVETGKEHFDFDDAP
jgi:hypothetical protein